MCLYNVLIKIYSRIILFEILYLLYIANIIFIINHECVTIIMRSSGNFLKRCITSRLFSIYICNIINLLRYYQLFQTFFKYNI